jgi:hypothetical protein
MFILRYIDIEYFKSGANNPVKPTKNTSKMYFF